MQLKPLLSFFTRLYVKPIIDSLLYSFHLLNSAENASKTQR